MAISIVQGSLVRSSGGSKIRITGKVQYTTYQTGGPFLAASQFGLDQIEYCDIEQKGGYQLDSRAAANGTGVNFLAYSGTGGGTITTSANAVVVVAANTGTLASIPAMVQSVSVTAGGLTGPYIIVPSSIVPQSGQVSINLTTGVMTFNAADAVTSATVSYILAAIGAGGSGEVPNGTNLAGLGQIEFMAIGL